MCQGWYFIPKKLFNGALHGKLLVELGKHKPIPDWLTLNLWSWSQADFNPGVIVTRHQEENQLPQKISMMVNLTKAGDGCLQRDLVTFSKPTNSFVFLNSKGTGHIKSIPGRISQDVQTDLQLNFTLQHQERIQRPQRAWDKQPFLLNLNAISGDWAWDS